MSTITEIGVAALTQSATALLDFGSFLTVDSIQSTTIEIAEPVFPSLGTVLIPGTLMLIVLFFI